VKPVIRGVTMKLVVLVAVPAGVVTLIAPLVAFAGTVKVICVPLLTVNAAEVPLSLTAVAPRRLPPWMTTLIPGAPPAGLKLVIDGPVATPTPRTDREGLSPPVNVTSPTKVSADVGLKRTVTVCVCPAASEYVPPDTMLNGAAVLGRARQRPVPTFWTAKVLSADAPTVTVPKSRESGVTAITGSGAWPSVHSSDMPSASEAVWKLNMVATSGDTWTPTVAVAPPSRSGQLPPKIVSR
jgi:hypothetical protein